MQTLLFINTFFEEELSVENKFSILDWLEKHPLYLQLHYLSCLVADKQEIPLLAYQPDRSYLNHLENLRLFASSYELIDSLHPSDFLLSSWGPSSSLASWALERKLPYLIPSTLVTKEVNSKAFSHLLSPTLETAALLSDELSLKNWWASIKGPKVLKTLQGSSGRGHFISSEEDVTKAISFFRKQIESSKALLAEPWLDRLLDFSSQWKIHQNGSYEYLGATLCQNSSKGSYQKSLVGSKEILFKEYLPFLEEHLKKATKMIEKLRELSFFGNVGFDAMIYKDPISQIPMLYPIVEINARKTMGWVALKLHEKFPEAELFSLEYKKAGSQKNSLLPRHIFNPKTGKTTHFSKELCFELNPVCF
jgi:hypothetical protein